MNKSSLAALIMTMGALALAPAQAAERDRSGPGGEFERICAAHPDRAAHEAKFAEFLSSRLKLTDAQKAAFQAFQEARAQSVERATARLCASRPDLATFEGRLGFHQTFLEDRLDAVKAENPKLIAFYKSLDAEQQAKFDKIRQHVARREGR
jgi:hypothetical protein